MLVVSYWWFYRYSRLQRILLRTAHEGFVRTVAHEAHET